jgi:hypothetical protein
MARCGLVKTLKVAPNEAVLEFEIRAAEMPALQLLDTRCGE